MLRSCLGASRQCYTCVVVPIRSLECLRPVAVQRRLVHTSPILSNLPKDHPDKYKIKQMQMKKFDYLIPGKEDASSGDNSLLGIPIPTADTPSKIFDGTRFDELPYIFVQSTMNNTITHLADYKGTVLTHESGGTVGFRGTKKGTTIAAQTAAQSLGQKTLKKGIKTVRVVLRGIGPGRQPALLGLVTAGLTVVSITDETKIPHNGCRPRKAKRY